MSSTSTCESADRQRTGSMLGSCVRAAVLVAAWLPAWGIVAVFVPKFKDLFARLRESAELPAVTERLVELAELNGALFFAPFGLALALLIFADIGLATLLSSSARKWLYWIWFGVAAAFGVAVAAIVAMALMLPILKMSASI